ncbi:MULTISPECIES: S8 family serine peptidase [Arthrobacter]|uniref:S8 family serine peptidase n=2 Tax=Arthrobacter TaxID=1663 RepID=A0ABU9KK43_9MICC|nr:S8 family serine peptidase [Arthrobacter sp. YJM1]MDP5226494.1 S8 family serine peptidase [Arthrobacter sp. YJM1]
MRRTGKSFLRARGVTKALAVGVSLPVLLGGAVLPAAQAAPAMAPGQSAGQQLQAGKYIVVLAEKPAASYEGGTSGLAATKPEPGRKLDADNQNVKRYRQHLESVQKQVAGQEGVTIKRSFSTALNAFSAQLSAEQANTLAKDPQVLVVAPDTQNAPDYSSMDFLNLPGNTGVWQKQFGGAANAGKGVVVGVIDTGYTPSSPFFAGDEVKPLQGDPQVGVPYRTDDGKIAMLKANGETFKSDCQAGQGFAGTECNSKVLAAHYFADAFTSTVPPEHRAPSELISPVDTASHGTHTASTAAGNADVRANLGDRDMGVTSGVAPAAKLSIYKVCWEDDDPNTGGCYSSSSVAAIDQAVLDGVDVLNYSISGSATSTTDPVSLAFLSAVSAGIFVSASAGNSGPDASTVNHGAPWLTTVAASSFSSELQGTVEFEDGSKYRGASLMAHEVPYTNLVLSANAASGTGNAALCAPGSLDPAKVSGKIVVCDRGVVARLDKSAEVQRAGGVGMVLVNLTPSSEDVDQHSVPTVHVNPPASQAIKDKVAANPAIKARLVNHDTTGLPEDPQPQVAGFSSRGPLLASGSDLLKPDVAAPGVAVLAGVSPIAEHGAQFGMMSGTSMASPHIAGFGALAKAKHPDWSPAAIKSALMTSATDLKNADGSKDTDVFATGAGQVNPGGFLDPGLVYDQGQDDYLRYIQGLGFDLGIPGLGSTMTRDVNVPSFALGNLTGKIEVTRTLTALTPGLYRAVADVPGVNVKVTPSVLNFNAVGQKRTFKVTFENAGAALGQFAMGRLSWQGNGKSVTSPIAVRPQSVVAASNLTFTTDQATGKASIPVTSGSGSPTKLTLDGLSKADATAIQLVPGAVDLSNNASNAVKTVTVPAGTPFARFAVVSSDDKADFDMYVIDPKGKATTVATSSASEALSLNNPAPGTYTILANLYASPGNAPTKASLEASILGANVGNATIAPNPLVLKNGKSGNLTLAWNGLTPGSYIGRISFDGASAPTFVSVVVGPSGAVAPAVESPDDATRAKAEQELQKRPDLGDASAVK